jgi:excisionase family DNA binding protein
MDFLTVKEVAQELRLSEETVKRMLRTHKMPGYQVGREWRIDRAEYEEWRKQRRNQYRASQES